MTHTGAQVAPLVVPIHCDTVAFATAGGAVVQLLAEYIKGHLKKITAKVTWKKDNNKKLNIFDYDSGK